MEESGQATVFEYPKVFLYRTSVIVNSRSRSRETKRNNSCVFYNENDTVFYGLVEKIFSVANSGEVYCIVSTLAKDSTQSLCTDSVTNAQLNSHLVSCAAPNTSCIIPIHEILGKCVYMDLHEQVGNVFVSHFPNCNESY